VPYKPKARCPDCKSLHEGTGRCERCKDVTEAIYRDPRWQELRDRVLSEEPQCKVRGCWKMAVEVDHKRSLRTAPHLAFVRSNVQGLCKRHHSQKTRLEQTG